MGDFDDLPASYDVIVVGTGLTESIVAAAASRVGKKVLHLDSNDYYGEYWATLGLDHFLQFVNNGKKEIIGQAATRTCISSDAEVSPSCKLESPDSTINYFLVKTRNASSVLRNVACQWYSNCNRIDNQHNDSKLVETQDGLPIKESTGEVSDDSSNNESTPSDKELESSLECNEKVTEIKVEGKKEVSQKKIIWSRESILSAGKKFNIDLAPKIMYSTGEMVQILLKSGVSRYTEFMSVKDIVTLATSSKADGCLSNSLVRVPCTKSDVFASKTVSLVDKRILMRVIKTCNELKPEDIKYQDYKEKTFAEYLETEWKLGVHLIPYVLHSIAVATDCTLFPDAIQRIQKFLKDVGRYSTSPFLWPLYGSGELLQAFCRLSAVYGGIYYLSRGAEFFAIAEDDGIQSDASVLDTPKKCIGVVTRGRLLRADHIVSSVFSCPMDYLNSGAEPSNNEYGSRIVLFTDRSLLPDKESEGILMMNYVPKEKYRTAHPVLLLELHSATSACPEGLYVVHISSKEGSHDSSLLTEMIDTLFDREELLEPEQETVETYTEGSSKSGVTYLPNQLEDDHLRDWIKGNPTCTENNDDNRKPRILCFVHYNLPNMSSPCFNASKPTNIHFCSGPDFEIDFDESINEAKSVFAAMYPGEEFLEPVPDPNDITLDETNLSTEDDLKNEQSHPTEDSELTVPDQSNPLVETKSELHEDDTSNKCETSL